MTLQIIRDRVVKFNADGVEGLLDRKAPGRPSILNATHRAAPTKIIDNGPTPDVHGVVRWRITDLMQWLKDEFDVSISKPTLSRELRALGYRKLSARPRHHAQFNVLWPARRQITLKLRAFVDFTAEHLQSQ